MRSQTNSQGKIKLPERNENMPEGTGIAPGGGGHAEIECMCVQERKGKNSHEDEGRKEEARQVSVTMEGLNKDTGHTHSFYSSTIDYKPSIANQPAT